MPVVARGFRVSEFGVRDTVGEPSRSRDPTTRFSDRVADYLRYRPTYPPAVVDLVAREGRLTPGATVADVGSGTGKLSECFLRAGYRVVGVEPNREMREAAETLFRGNPLFLSVDGAAEATTLADHSVDAIVAGQAFHWFDAERARVEFRRILRSGGLCALVWNERMVDASPLQRAYEDLLTRHCPEYPYVTSQHANVPVVRRFFEPRETRFERFEHAQQFDLAGFLGRLLSSSYVPTSGPHHDALLAAMRELFAAHQSEGRVTFELETLVYYADDSDGR